MKKIIITIIVFLSTMAFGDQTINLKINNALQIWNNDHNTGNLNELSKLYTPTEVIYYGKLLSKNSIIKNKLVYLKKYPKYYQSIDNISIHSITPQLYSVKFNKYITKQNKSTKVFGYLIFKIKDNAIFIVDEGDQTTLSGKNYGDYNGDGKKESMSLVAPELSRVDGECIGSCNCYIKFSDINIPSIRMEMCIDGAPENLGDLNNNKTDEIGFIPGWFQGNWHSYYLKSFINNRWIDAIKPFNIYSGDLENGVIPVKKAKNGYVIVTESTEDFATRQKLIKVLK